MFPQQSFYLMLIIVFKKVKTIKFLINIFFYNMFCNM